MGLEGALYQTLRSTNTIENLNSLIATYTRNVKRWRDPLGSPTSRFQARLMAYRCLIWKAPKAMPRSTPRPVPESDSETSPFVRIRASADLVMPA